MTNNILIFGGSGLLGKELSIYLSSIFNVMSTYFSNTINNNIFSKTDLLDKDSLNNLFNEFNPNIVVNCAAYTNVDNAEINKKNCRDLNVVALQNIIDLSTKNTFIIHISTDYVFDGKQGNYSENDNTYPVNYYGITKLECLYLLYNGK